MHNALDKNAALAPHLVVNGLVKNGKSTVLNHVFPAVAREQAPTCLFLRLELQMVSIWSSYCYRCCCSSTDGMLSLLLYDTQDVGFMDLLDRMYGLMKQWALANDIVSTDDGIFKHASAYTNKVMQTQGRLLDLLECMGIQYVSQCD
jgi:hypothetical protein